VENILYPVPFKLKTGGEESFYYSSDCTWGCVVSETPETQIVSLFSTLSQLLHVLHLALNPEYIEATAIPTQQAALEAAYAALVTKCKALGHPTPPTFECDASNNKEYFTDYSEIYFQKRRHRPAHQRQ